MIQYSLIQAGISDLAALRDISISTFVDTYAQYNTQENMQRYIDTEFSNEVLSNILEINDSQFYFALDEHKIIGYIKVNFAPAQTDLHDPQSLELERIYVVKEYKGKGAGKFLLDRAMQIAVDNSFVYLWLGVWEKNTAALEFYARNGFEPFGTHTFYLGDDEQKDLLLRKDCN